MVDSIEDLDLTPPKTAQENAQKVLDWRDEHGDDVNGMTRTGWVRANQLAGGEELSADIVGRMASFNRHRSNSDIADEYEGEPWKDAGYVAWLGWGGDEGVDWAMRMSDRIDSIENSGRDKVTTLSHKHQTKTMENSIVDNIIDESVGNEVKAISKNTFTGYFQDAPEFQEENWESSVNRLSEIHGMVRSYITSIARHEESGHGRGENVPTFEDPIDTDTLNQFAHNVENNVEDETYTDLVGEIVDMDKTLRKIFHSTVVHHNSMHGDGDIDVSQLLSEEMVKGEDYNTMPQCMDYHAGEKDMDADQAFAVCANEFDVEEENKEDIIDRMGEPAQLQDVSQGRKNIKEAEMLAEQVWMLKDIMKQFGQEFGDLARRLETERDISEVQNMEDQTISAVNLMMNKLKSPVKNLHSMSTEDQSFEMAEVGEISEGDKARWDAAGGNTYGVVDIVQTDGSVSAEPKGPEMDGSEDEPAYKLQVYDIEETDDGEDKWVGTDTYVVHRADAITIIDDFPEQRTNSEMLEQGIIPNHRPLGDFSTTESDDWDGIDYSEFESAYDFEENFADLSNDDKRVVAAHFGRVDNSSYEDATYSDLQLPHHSPDSGDVDRAAVIAARQRLPQSDMPQEDLEAIDTHLVNHLKEDFGEEDVEPVIEKENAVERPNVYRDADEAVRKSREMGMTGIHTVREDEETLYKPGATPEDFQQAKRENSESLSEGQLVSFETDYGKSFGRVKDNDEQDYNVEIYSAELGGGWKSSGRTKTMKQKELELEDQFPNSLNDVFNNDSTVGAETVEEKDQELSADDIDEDDVEGEEVTESVDPSEVQQAKKK